MNINKLIISTSAVIAFAIPTVSVAESGVYASLRQSILFTDSGMASGDTDDASIVDQDSRVGLQGNQDFGTYSGFGRVEFGFDGSTEAASPAIRLGYVGVSGDFGTVSVGSQWSAWDTFIGDEHTNFVSEGAWHNGTDRNTKTIKYAGRIGGLAIEADAVLVNQEGIANGGLLDEMQFALGYGLGGFTLQLALIERDGGVTGYLGGGTLYGGRLSYDTGPLSLSVAVAQDDTSFSGTDADAAAAIEETLGVKLKASYATGSNTLLAVVTTADNEVAANAPLGVALGYQHDLSNRSRVSLELSSVDPDIAGLDATTEGGVMYRHDW